MLKTFPIDFVRQALEQKLLEEHIKDLAFFGGKDQVNILSFYEQLKSQDEVDRFVETYRDLADQQNRTGLILNGVVLSPENPTYTNLYSATIVPLTFTCSLRCTLENRDQSIITINNLIDKLKGRKVDIAQLNCIDENGKPYSTPFMVGTIGQNEGASILKDGDFIGIVDNLSQLQSIISNLSLNGVLFDKNSDYYLYAQKTNGQLGVLKFNYSSNEDVYNSATDDITQDATKTTITQSITIGNGSLTSIPEVTKITMDFELHGDNADEKQKYKNVQGVVTSSGLYMGFVVYTTTFTVDNPDFVLDESTPITSDEPIVRIENKHYEYIEDDGTYGNIIFPPEHTSFDKYKLSFSFDAIRCDEPRNLNGEEYCELSFGGSATLTNNGVKFGNDLLKISMHKNKIVAQTPIDLSTSTTYYLEPLEMPSGSNANTQINQLMSNKFVANTHSDSLALTLQYTFIVDENIDLIKQLYKYGRYGKQALATPSVNDISPNIIYDVIEYTCSWGVYEKEQVLAKIVGDIDIDNSESDVLTIGITMQIQGVNN